MVNRFLYIMFVVKKYDKNVGQYYLEELKSINEDFLRTYYFLSYNCLQVSMEVLLKRTYYGSYQVYYNEIFCWYNKPWYSNFICNRCCNFEYFQLSDLYEGLENSYTYIWALSFMPDYTDSGSVLFVFDIIAISFLFNLVFDFLLIFRKIKLSRMKKFLCALISAAMVSPYALLISFDCF